MALTRGLYVEGVTGGRLSGRTLHVLAAIVVCAELVGTIAFLRSDDGSQQVVEAAPAPTPVPPRPFMLAR